MKILAIDPGPTTCGVVVLHHIVGDWPPRVMWSDPRIYVDHAVAVAVEGAVGGGLLVCEWLTTYGAAVGASVLDTARVIGRLEQATLSGGAMVALMTRPEVCLELCQSRRAKKSEVRAALLEIYSGAGSGGGKTPQIGTKKAPGPLYGVTSHAWDALGVGIAWLRREANDEWR